MVNHKIDFENSDIDIDEKDGGIKEENDIENRAIDIDEQDGGIKEENDIKNDENDREEDTVREVENDYKKMSIQGIEGLIINKQSNDIQNKKEEKVSNDLLNNFDEKITSMISNKEQHTDDYDLYDDNDEQYYNPEVIDDTKTTIAYQYANLLKSNDKGKDTKKISYDKQPNKNTKIIQVKTKFQDKKNSDEYLTMPEVNFMNNVIKNKAQKLNIKPIGHLNETAIRFKNPSDNNLSAIDIGIDDLCSELYSRKINQYFCKKIAKAYIKKNLKPCAHFQCNNSKHVINYTDKFLPEMKGYDTLKKYKFKAISHSISIANPVYVITNESEIFDVEMNSCENIASEELSTRIIATAFNFLVNPKHPFTIFLAKHSLLYKSAIFVYNYDGSACLMVDTYDNKHDEYGDLLLKYENEYNDSEMSENKIQTFQSEIERQSWSYLNGKNIQTKALNDFFKPYPILEINKNQDKDESENKENYLVMYEITKTTKEIYDGCNIYLFETKNVGTNTLS